MKVFIISILQLFPQHKPADEFYPHNQFGYAPLSNFDRLCFCDLLGTLLHQSINIANEFLNIYI